MAEMARQEVLHAYRHLHRAALKAVCHSKPASFVARDLLRRTFRDKTSTFDGRAIRRTVWFLNNAAREKGTEHKIVKNLILVQFWRNNTNNNSWTWICANTLYGKKEDHFKDTAYAHYEQTISMLNKTMGLCLPLR